MYARLHAYHLLTQDICRRRGRVASAKTQSASREWTN